MEVVAVGVRHQRFIAVGFQWEFQPGDPGAQTRCDGGAARKAQATFARSSSSRAARSITQETRGAGRIATETGDVVHDSPLNNATAHYLHNMLYVLGATRETTAMPVSLEAEDLPRQHDREF